MFFCKCVHESTITCMFPCIAPVSAHFRPHRKRVHWIGPWLVGAVREREREGGSEGRELTIFCISRISILDLGMVATHYLLKKTNKQDSWNILNT